MLREENLKSIKTVRKYIPDIVKIAQKIYDNWDEDDIDTYVGGGICHIIADEIAYFLRSKDIDVYVVSSNFEQHVYCILQVKEGVYSLDIPPYLYERGGGYSWSKIPDVVFDESFIMIELLSPDPKDIYFYVEEY